MSTKNPTYPELLQAMADKMGVMSVYDELLYQYPQFDMWPASHNPMLHHHEIGGLVRHTWEIVDIGMHTIPTLNLCSKVDPREFYLAALFHDSGKLFDYAMDKDGKVTSTPHKRHIHHISRSGLIWHDIIQKFSELKDKYHDNVYHAILAHHGMREWGSPVAPNTHTAWLLHLCDSMSARMDDCDKLDVVKHPDHEKA